MIIFTVTSAIATIAMYSLRMSRPEKPKEDYEDIDAYHLVYNEELPK